MSDAPGDREMRSRAICARPEQPHCGYRVHGVHSELHQVNSFLRALELRGLSPKTVRAYAMDLVVALRWLGTERLSVHELTEQHMVGFIGAQRGTDAAPRSINRRLTTLRLWHRFVTDEDIKRGPGVTT